MKEPTEKPPLLHQLDTNNNETSIHDSSSNQRGESRDATYPSSESGLSLGAGKGLDISAGSATMLLPTKYITTMYNVILQLGEKYSTVGAAVHTNP